VTSFRLADGSLVRIRPIQASDKFLFERSRVAGSFSDETMHRRFLSPKPGFSRSELRYLTEVDGHDHVAFVAVKAHAPGELVAVARFVRLHDDPSTAEAAIVVADEKQGKGLGRMLALMLADAAREVGVERIQGTMLSDNPAAYRLMRAIGRRLEDRGHRQGVHELVAELAA
jgi:RimJ/RimL family protein N-acetyltransferase